LINITFITELQVKGDWIQMYLPNAINPKQQDWANHQGAMHGAGEGGLTMVVAVDSPFKILELG
jgi:hypothetical protein